MRTGSTQQQTSPAAGGGPPQLTGDSRASSSYRVLKTSVTSVSSASSASSASSVPPAVRKPPGRPEARLRFFEFVRELRAAHRGADPVTLRSHVAAWHEQDGRTSDFDSTTWLEFLEAWPTVTCPAGTDLFEEALSRVDAGDLAPEAEGQPPSFGRLISVCWHMRGPTGRFFLSSRDAGLALLPCDKRTEAAREAHASNGHRAMQHLVRIGRVECKHPGSRGIRKAARYRYISGETS